MQSLFSAAASTSTSQEHKNPQHRHQAMLRFIAEHRTFQADQLHRALPHFSSERRVREALDVLVADKQLKRVRSPFKTGGRRRNTYIATSKTLASIDPSIEELVAPTGTPAHRSTPKNTLVGHELLITEHCQQLSDITTKRQDLTLYSLKRSCIAKNPIFAAFKPDAIYQYNCLLGNMIELFDVLSGVWDYGDILEKLKKFWRWWESESARQWLIKQYLQQHPSSRPIPLCRFRLLVHNRKTGNHLSHVRRVLRASLEVPRFVRDQIFVASVADLNSPHDIGSTIWYNAGDLNRLAKDWSQLDDEQKKRRLATDLSLLPQHRHFPTP